MRPRPQRKLRSLTATGALPESFAAEYDGGGRRARSTHNGVTTTYSLGLLEEVAGGGSTVYTPGVSQRQNGVDRFFHSDWLGSTRYLTDGTGLSAPTAYRFEGYGNTSAQAGPDATHRKFAGGHGYESDGPAGLQLLGHRFYDPAVGRFLNPDPIGFGGGLNLYAYCENDPVGMVDPEGFRGEALKGHYLVRYDPVSYPESDAWRRLTKPFRDWWSRPENQALAGQMIWAVVISRQSRGAGPRFTMSVPRRTPGAIVPGRSRTVFVQQKPAVPCKGGVYVLRDPENGQVMRSGRTKDLASRQRDHARAPATKDLVFQPMYRTDDYAEQRGLEQLVHEKFKPPLNAIGGVDQKGKREKRELYEQAAKSHLERLRKGRRR